MSRLRLSAVTIPAMHVTVFVVNFKPESLPVSVDWADWTIDDVAQLVVPDDLDSWPHGAEAPGLAILCKSINNPKYYKVFGGAADVCEAEFVCTGTTYGGVYSESHWEGFVRDFPRILNFLRVPEVDPLGVPEEVLPAMKRAY